MLLVYAFVAPPASVDDLRGVDDLDIEVVGAAPVAAVVSRCAEIPAADRTRALAHARVVAALADRTATLSARYGLAAADTSALARLLTDQAGELLDALARVGDTVEFAIRGRAPVPAPPASPAGASGRAYLEARRDDERAREAASEQRRVAIEAASGSLLPFAREDRWVRGAMGPERCLLVARDDIAGVLAAAAPLDDDAVVRLTGPWPPYTFASLALTPEEQS